MTVLAPYRFLRTIDEYLAALRAYRFGDTVPVLGGAAEAHRVVAELSERDPVRPVDPAGECFVVSPAGSPAAGLAEALATAVGGGWAEFTDPRTVGGRSGDSRYVVLVALAHEVSERTLTTIHDSLWEHRAPAEGGHLGVVVGADLADLSWLVAKGLGLPHRRVPEEEHLRIWPVVKDTPRRYGTGAWVLEDDAKASTVRPLLLDRYTSAVSLIGHGRDDVFHLNDTVICPIGAHRVDDPEAATSYAPVCAFTGRCYRPEVAGEDIVLSGRIRADAVFTNSCMGMRVDEGLYPREYLLAHGFIRGTAAAYLATGHVINGLLKLNDIFHTACGAGRSLGETATIINDHLRYERADLPYYTLLGLPWIRLAVPGRERSWDGYVLGPGEPYEAGGGVQAAAAAVAAAEAAGESCHVVYTSPRSEAALAGAVPQRLDATTVPALKHTLLSAGRRMTNLEDVAYTGLKYSRQGNMLVNVRDQVATLSTAVRSAAMVGDVTRIRRRIAAILTGVERAELTLAEALFERGIQSFQHYHDVWGQSLQLDTPILTDEDCAYCGRLLVLQRATHPLLERIGREARVCPRCGMIRDFPAGSPMATMVVRTPEHWHVGDAASARLEFRLGAMPQRPSRLAAGIFMANAAKNGMTFPAPRFVDVAADGTGELEVTVPVPGGARQHQEYVRAMVIVEGAVAFVTRPIWVRPALPVAAAAARASDAG